MEKSKFLILLIILNGVLLGCHKSKYSRKLTYYTNGNLESEINLVNDTIPHGYAKYYFPTGKIEAIVFYQNGKLEGLQKTFDMAGVLRKSIQYKNGNLNGVSKIFYSSGKIEEISNWQDGNQFGNLYSFYENGKLKQYNFFDFNSECKYVLKFDSLYGKLVKEEGLSFCRNFYSTNVTNNILDRPGNLEINIAVPEPPIRIIKLYMGEIRLNEEWKIENLKNLSIKNNIAIFSCYLSKGDHQFVTISEVYTNTMTKLKVDTVFTKIKVE